MTRRATITAALLMLLAGIAPAAVPPPEIHSVTPATAFQTGGQIVTIDGIAFRAPVRVFFEVADAVPVEGVVVASSDIRITVVVPPAPRQIGARAGPATIIVVAAAGTAEETRVSRSGIFAYEPEILTPRITSVTPSEGTISGKTVIVIEGEGFQPPVDVIFYTARGRTSAFVHSVRYDRIVAETPIAASLGAVTGDTVGLTVINRIWQRQATLANAFRYYGLMAIHSISPSSGPASGGTIVRIRGENFEAPVSVTIAGATARTRSVTRNEIVVETGAATIFGCRDSPTQVAVTRDTGNERVVSSAFFTYIVEPPVILSIAPQRVVAGERVAIRLRHPNVWPAPRIFIDGRAAGISSVTLDSDGAMTYVLAVPQIGFPRAACTTPDGLSGTEARPARVDLSIHDERTGCTAVATLEIVPPQTACRPERRRSSR